MDRKGGTGGGWVDVWVNGWVRGCVGRIHIGPGATFSPAAQRGWPFLGLGWDPGAPWMERTTLASLRASSEPLGQ